MPGSREDPRLGGATLHIFDVAGAAGMAAFDLDASGWRAFGDPAGSRGYKYWGRDDDSRPDPPCKVVLLRPDVVKAICRGTDVTLAPPFGGPESVLLGMPSGSPTRRYCADLGGRERRNDAHLVRRKRAPSPAACRLPPASETVCGVLPPIASGTCQVVAGGLEVRFDATVLAPGHVYRGGSVLVDAQGTITCVGCECAASSPGATVVRCPSGVVSPGLINLHEHITFAHNLPFVDAGERYEHRHEWRLGLNGHTAIPATGGASQAQIQWGELRHLLAGTTSMVGAGSAPGLVRNLDTLLRQEGLGQPDVTTRTFPLGDAGGQQMTTGCAYPVVPTAMSVALEDAYVAHVAEGIDQAARNELSCLSSSADGGEDIVRPQSAFVHLVGAAGTDYVAPGAEATELIWSPRSNISLYGETARVSLAARLGVRIALGTDWIVSGSMNLLRELRCADSFNQTHLDGFFTDEDLWDMVARNSAVASAAHGVIGALEVGEVADIAIFDASTDADHKAVVAADPEDVVLVVRGGTALYGDAALVSALRGAGTCESLDVCGVQKAICLTSEIGQDLATLEANAGGIYPLFFCGDPAGEPTCQPQRSVSVDGSTVYTGLPSASDPDGDGIEASDNCPTVFNPVRPLDGGVQPDSDDDGIGDACDATPVL